MFRSQRMLATPTGACKALWHQRSAAHVSSRAGVAQDWFATDDTSWMSCTGRPGCLSKHAVWLLASRAAVCVGRRRVPSAISSRGSQRRAEACRGAVLHRQRGLQHKGAAFAELSRAPRSRCVNPNESLGLRNCHLKMFSTAESSGPERAVLRRVAESGLALAGSAQSTCTQAASATTRWMFNGQLSLGLGKVNNLEDSKRGQP